ncbi:hypothetical protein UVI_02024710 [Ustilaginoidea virens]|uniref:Zn(2)-C6 fungal-type domain-containing protein n=1 Tax=Ustilaginoidea virens TaxID=1159556 RepID=A0A1B5KQY4_USTVR|nr:hypothetical protein UVI_02024710 [Ustilaginoidea virens]
MASVTSRASDRSSPYDFDLDSAGDTDESWQYVDYSSGASASGSVGFLSSPASGSLSGYAIVGHAHLTPPPPPVDMDQAMFLPAATLFPGSQNDQYPMTSLGDPNEVAAATATATATAFGIPPFMASLPPDFFAPADQGPMAQTENFASQPFFQPDPGAAMASWNAHSPTAAASTHMVPFEEVVPSPANMHSSTTTTTNTPSSSSALSSSSPKSPPIKAEQSFPPPPPSSSLSSSSSSSSLRTKSLLALRRCKEGKVEKKKAESTADKFVIVTPNTISAHAGRPNPFECFEAMHATHRGRKGPLAHETKENALQVRRLGACFCCHSRKVRCDKERPCRHCERLMLYVPQVVCWQFQDFIPVLFPDLIRAHFRKPEMARFLRDSVGGFRVAGAERACEVELFSGSRFSAVLSVRANFFTATTCDVLQHWHMIPDRGRANLQSNGSAPIGIELGTSAQRDDLRKRVKAYIQDVISEPFYAEQVTESLRSTQLPMRILKIVQTYAKQSDSTMVKRALSIYAMHYIMTRHLCITRKSLLAIQSTGLVPQNSPWVTPRVLARQVKALVDELIMREMQLLFELFSKSLKPKHRRDWAPCTAAFLVLCLFIEAVETTADNFVVAQNEIDRRNTSPPKYKQGYVLDICKELENLPFKQFAYQFHNIYQTHAKDANVKSFNPLFDDSFEEQHELDGPAVEMVKGLRELFHGEAWRDLQFLSDDDVIVSRGESKQPIDSSVIYTGRLVAKFLLSFTNENATFGGQI